MTNKEEALRMALEALETLMLERGSIYDKAITAIREALAEQPAQQQDIDDWKEQYEKQKRRAEMWVAKYEADIGQLEKAGPVTAQQQEPVAWMCSNKKLIDKGFLMFTKTKGGDWDIPVYTSPPAKPWVNPSLKEYEEIILANMTPKNLDEREAVIGALNDMVVLLEEKNT